MGPLLVTGAACFGGAVAIGLLTAASSRALAATTEPRALRGLYILSVAFREGIAILGVVIGILAIFLVGVGDTSSAIVVAVPAVGGAIAGIFLALRGGPDRTATRFLGLRFIAGLGVLGVVVGSLGVLDGDGATVKGGDGPFVLVAAILLSVQLIAGVIGAADLEAAGQSPSGGASAIGTPGTLEFVRARMIRMAALFQLVAIAAVIVAISLIVVSSTKPL